jgi:hypothetical protein
VQMTYRVLVLGAVLVTASLAAPSFADPPAKTPLAGVLDEFTTPPLAAELLVRVVDSDDQPVVNARVTPWALRSSQGHGWWRKGEPWAAMDPQDSFTDASGATKVRYPYYRARAEQVRTTSVSLHVDHPDFAYPDDLHIDVPLETHDPYVIKLRRGVPVELRPTMDGQPFAVDELFAFWSDGRSWLPGANVQKCGEHVLRVPAMPPGDNSVLLVKLDGDRATHFSKIVDFNLTAGEPKTLEIAMRPARRIEGVLSDDVPRPVKDGRVKLWTLPPAKSAFTRVDWWTWAPVKPDGTFVIDSWPAEEPIQLVALSQGYMASNGAAPKQVVDPAAINNTFYRRAQVFEPVDGQTIKIEMTRLAQCVVTASDEDEKPVAGVSVLSSPNVGWWNGGSQIYCHPLARGERMARVRDYNSILDNDFANPFEATTDAKGRTVLELPSGRERLAVINFVYELPVFLGRRDMQINLTQDKPTEVELRLQPRGTEKLGEWDKLAGVVFGCSTREGRRICALPEVRKKMDEFAERFRDGKNQRDPKLLFEAYTAVADAFVTVGDTEEAAKWRKKAAEQAEKAHLAESKTGAKAPE